MSCPHSGVRYVLLLTATVAAHELVYTTSRIDELSLTREEGVRSARDLYLDQRILYTVDDDSLLGGHCGASDKDVFVGHVLEHHGTVVLRMDSFLHYSSL